VVYLIIFEKKKQFSGIQFTSSILKVKSLHSSVTTNVFCKTKLFRGRWIVQSWNKLWREVVQFLSMEVFNTRLDKAAKSLIW